MLRALFVFAVLFITGCVSDPLSLSQSAEEDFHKGEAYIVAEEYGRAIQFLEKFSAKYPYSQYATASEFIRLKAAYLDGQFVLSETLGLRFVDAHPDHKDRIYAQYLVAMSYYKQSSGAMLDQQFSHRARDAFLKLNEAFPNNPYTSKIQKYFNILTNRVAQHEMFVAKFYFKKQLLIAAINRLLVIKNNYIDANIADEALYYLALSYISLEQHAYAKEIITLLQSKFPQSAWREKSKLL